MNATVARTSTMAIVSLIFGILCWIGLPFIGAVVAIICGHSARGEIRRAPPGTIDGDGMALTGLILGWVHMAIVIACVFLLFAVFGGLAFFSQFGH